MTVRVAFSWLGIDPIHKCKKRMDQHVYKDTLTNKIMPFAEESIPLKLSFMDENDENHISTLVKSCLRDIEAHVFKRPSQLPSRKPIKNV